MTDEAAPADPSSALPEQEPAWLPADETDPPAPDEDAWAAEFDEAPKEDSLPQSPPAPEAD